MTAKQGRIRYWDLAIATGFMTAPDTWMLTFADQARANFVTHCSLVIIKVRVTLGYGESEQV